MTADKTERDWVSEIGKPAYESIAEMVAALECDYDRLEELRDERKDLIAEAEEAKEAEADDQSPTRANEALAALDAWDTENLTELQELEKAAGECKDADDARERIEEDALSVEVRSGWVCVGEEMTPEDFAILLTTGGPAVRIRGELDEHGEPYRAWLEVQDWGKPWSQYFQAEQDTLLTYARCFCFAS
jgi:hypothetical protein